MVKLIVEILEPFHGRICDLACGSGGMFVQSARFVEEHKKNPSSEISIYGQERVAETVKLCKMNLAVHGLAGDIRQGNTYYEDLHTSPGKFDFHLANPPFNVDRVDKDRLKDDPRFPFGLPKVDNANYLWIQIFYSALNKNGRAGFVMANSAADARASEMEIRKQLIQDRAVDVMVAVGPNMFYTVTLPCMLWFLDRGKKGTERQDKVLFLDARHIFRQIDRAHRDFTPEQIEFLANIVRLYRGEKPENQHESAKMMAEKFPKGKYADVPGLCKVATVKEIEAQGWSLNPGRYVGVAEGEADDFDFKERLEELNEELETLNVEARELEDQYCPEFVGDSGVVSMTGFATITVEEATECLIDYRGKTPPKTESGIRLITAKVIKNGRILEDPKEFIATDFYDEWMRRGLPHKFDVLVTTEAPLGEVAMLRKTEKVALAQRVILLRAKPDRIEAVSILCIPVIVDPRGAKVSLIRHDSFWNQAK